MTTSLQPPARFWHLEILQRLRPRGARRAYGSLLMAQTYRDWINRGRAHAWSGIANAAPLAAEDVQLVDTLQRDGIAFSSIDRLLGPGTLSKMQAEFERKLADYSRRSSRNQSKQYLERLEEDVVLGDGDVLADVVLADRVLRIAGSYLGLIPRFVSRDVWNTLAAQSTERVASQRWHRDYNDLQMLKMFVYLSDVGPRNGPFEYVRGSHYAGPLGQVLYRDLNDRGLRRYPSETDLAPHLAAIETNKVTCTGTAGTVIFVDTFGFHRGGYVEDGTRRLVMALFASQANVHPPNFVVDARAGLFRDPLRRAVCGLAG